MHIIVCTQVTDEKTYHTYGEGSIAGTSKMIERSYCISGFEPDGRRDFPHLTNYRNFELRIRVPNNTIDKRIHFTTSKIYDDLSCRMLS